MVAGCISQTDGVVLHSDTHLHTLSKLSIRDQRMREVSMYVCVQQRLGIALYDHVHLQQQELAPAAASYMLDSSTVIQIISPHLHAHGPTNH